MIKNILLKLDETDKELQEEIKHAIACIKSNDAAKCSNARMKVQEAIAELLLCRY